MTSHTPTRLQAFCLALGWQGGTVHQVSAEIGVSVDDLMQEVTDEVADTIPYGLGYRRGYVKPLPVDRTAWTLTHCKPDWLPLYWLGVADGIIAKGETP